MTDKLYAGRSFLSEGNRTKWLWLFGAIGLFILYRTSGMKEIFLFTTTFTKLFWTCIFSQLTWIWFFGRYDCYAMFLTNDLRWEGLMRTRIFWFMAWILGSGIIR